MMPRKLEEDCLYAFVFGPGKGECVALWIPPGVWVVVDSCKIGHQAAALHVLAKYAGSLGCLMLTHCHFDHYDQMPAVMSFGNWEYLACNDLSIEHEDEDDPEAGKRGDLEESLSRFRARHQDNKDKFWWTWRSETKVVGEATLTVLHPEEKIARQNPSRKSNQFNEISSAMVVEWESVRLVLGADTPNPFWRQIGDAFADQFLINDHQFAKLPHHGSGGSLDRALLEGAEDRIWVVTPYNSGRKKLPDFGDGDGVDQILQHASEVYLTGLPVSHSKQSESPCVATRQQIRDKLDPIPTTFQLPGFTGIDVTPNSTSPCCYVVTKFAPSGRAEVIACGPGSVRIGREEGEVSQV